MGKFREQALVRIDAFEAELDALAKRLGNENVKKFKMKKRAKLEIVDVARRRNVPVESVLAELRPGIEKIIQTGSDSADGELGILTIHVPIDKPSIH
ncbi:MAG: hypothetical protein RLZZ283_193 [Candidatus Parcubacteria bacterium]|jgi:hypothetical protein